MPNSRIPRRIIVVAAVAVACSSTAATDHGARASGETQPPLAAAGPAFLRELQAKVHGRWAEAWQQLYPTHQAVAPFALYVKCEQVTPFPAPMVSIHIDRVTYAAVDVIGSPTPVAGAAVAVRVALAWYGPRDPIVLHHVFHLVPSDGRWTWLLSSAEYDAYQAGTCPGSSDASSSPTPGRGPP